MLNYAYQLKTKINLESFLNPFKQKGFVLQQIAKTIFKILYLTIKYGFKAT